jgi:hypothetical protein
VSFFLRREEGVKGGNIVESYVVRIYRSEKDKPRILVGVVEEVGAQGKKAFTNLDELWEILNPKKKARARIQKGYADP